ncbi:MAG TPA: hypothetical protein VG013_35390 [Gemmataceae bacterium]|nr:hypothetical protein [Gemmataceae bacterium]
MTLELTEPLQTALDARPAEPLRLVDPRTQQAYVLLRAELYDRVKSLLQQDRLTEDERRVILEGVWRRAGWDDPAMDDYAALDPRKQP